MSTSVESTSAGVEVIDFKGMVARMGLEQPFETIVLKDHQLVGRHHLKKAKRCILSADKGTGKTSLVLSIGEDPEVNKNIPGFTVLVLCPEKGMYSYIRDIEKFPEYAGKVQLVYGTKSQRAQRWKNSTARYFVCTYASYLSDIGYRTNNRKTGELSTPIAPAWATNGQIDMVFFDEFHRQWRRRNKTWEACCKLFKTTEWMIHMSGSAVSKGPMDIWPALHMCDPKFWSTYWGYAYTWCEIEDGWAGKRIGPPKYDRVKQWRAAVKPYVFHVTAEQLGDMPPKTRDLMPVHIPDWQRNIHDDLIRQSYIETPDEEFIFAQNPLAKIHRVRQALICPRVLSPGYDVGQGIIDIRDDALEGGISHYVIFTPFVPPISHLATWLRDQGCKVWTLQGGIGLDEQQARLKAWRDSLDIATPENPSTILSTVKYAESWEVPEARYGYFLGEEWDNEENKQAEDRLRRLTSQGMTYIRYCQFVGTWQDGLINQMIERGKDVRMMFKDWYSLKKLLQNTDQNIFEG